MTIFTGSEAKRVCNHCSKRHPSRTQAILNTDMSNVGQIIAVDYSEDNINDILAELP
jgi:hypothetical protein